MNLWILIAIIAAATFALRFSFIAVIGRWNMPDPLRRALRFVPAAVLAAIVIPELVFRDGTFNPLDPRVFAGLLAILTAWRTRNAIFTLAVGMLSLWLIQALIR